MNCPYRIVIEPQEYNEYAKVVDPKKILTLPFSNLGQGSIPARNWVREHSISEGHKKHWILDDNIRHFFRFNDNKKIRVSDGTIFRCCEDFTNRYTNVGMSGMQYAFFIVGKSKRAPFIVNTRIYSCILLDNKLQYRWRGRYNEDTDLSLRILKGGYCTILFQTFLCGKSATMTMKGGNTDKLYQQDSKVDGRLLMAQSLAVQHPDVTRITQKWGRRQHTVNYSKFKNNKLIRNKNIEISDKVNNYGMELKYIK